MWSAEYDPLLRGIPYREKGKKIIVLITKKQRILEQLDNFSINRAALFPEIECVSDYIKDKYSKI